MGIGRIQPSPVAPNPPTGGVVRDASTSRTSPQGASQPRNRRRDAMGIAIAVASIVLSGVRFLWIEADFPAGLNWSGDLYTDEGWYLSGAISHAATGNWLVRGDFNPIVNMPMQQVLQALVFEVAGISLASARCTVAAWSIWVILGTYLLVRRYAGSLPGGLAALILSSNFTFFAYSRLALNEIPVMGWALLTVLALTGRPSRRSASIAAVLYAAAILTKPTALFALPVVLFMIWHRARNGKEVALDVGVFVLVVALLAGGYHLWALGHFPADYHYFNTLNIDSRVSLDLRTLIWNGLRTFRHSLVLDPLMWPLALVAAAALLAISIEPRANPLLWSAALWLGGASAVLLISSYHPPRYFLPLAVPMVVLVTILSVRPSPSAAFSKVRSVGRLLIVTSVLFNVALIARYLATPEYSFVEMADDIGDRMRQDRLEDPILLGNMADSISLATGVQSLDDRLGWMGLADKLELYSPDYYVSLGVDEDSNLTVSSYRPLELLAVYDVFENYNAGKRIYFYRIASYDTRN